MKINYTIILIGNESPGNAGAICRLMGNFNFTELILIDPVWTDPTEGLWLAHTETGIHNFRNRLTYSSLNEMFTRHNFSIVLGFTRRSGKGREISFDYRKYFKEFYHSINGKNSARKNKPGSSSHGGFPGVSAGSEIDIALVFGRESSGLADDEIKKCNSLIYIPTDPDSPSLNLSQAVCIILNEIYYYSVCLSEKSPLKPQTANFSASEFARGKGRKRKNSSDLNWDVDRIFELSTSSDREKFYRDIVRASSVKRLFVRNDESTFRTLFERIFTSPVITKKDLELLKAYIMRFIHAKNVGDKNL